MNITVYLGANEGSSPIYKEAVIELGKWIGDNGHTLVFGGSKTGLMGVLADTVLAGDADVIGIEYGKFIDMGYSHEGLTKLISLPTMSGRRGKMIELGDAFIAFPGGIGTLEEVSEIIVKDSLGELNKPYVFYNLNGYYDSLKDMFDNMEKCGFLDEMKRSRIRFADDINEIEKVIKG